MYALGQSPAIADKQREKPTDRSEQVVAGTQASRQKHNKASRSTRRRLQTIGIASPEMYGKSQVPLAPWNEVYMRPTSSTVADLHDLVK